ncbi:hypothetical protein ABEB36_001831 [Hypothenemus hampei]|uniref:Uncharacterized protein n=1 Tax=Hypothenemus hampei TaxID=57062 RepID=A0ABD1FFV7_HYPHA
MPWSPFESSDQHSKFSSFFTLKNFPYLHLAEVIWSIMSEDSPLANNRTAEVFEYSPEPGQDDHPSYHHNRPSPLLEEEEEEEDEEESKPLASFSSSAASAASSSRGKSPVATTSKDVAVQVVVSPMSHDGCTRKTAVAVEPGRGRLFNSSTNVDNGKKESIDSPPPPTLNNDDGHQGQETNDGQQQQQQANNDNDNEIEGGGDQENEDQRDRRDEEENKSRKSDNIDKLDSVLIPNECNQDKDYDEDSCIVKCLYVTMTCCECSIM